MPFSNPLSLNLWFLADARGSLYVKEMIKVFNEMDGAISDVIKQITSDDKAPVFEDNEIHAIPPDLKEVISLIVQLSVPALVLIY
jgi:hypothetical protein